MSNGKILQFPHRGYDSTQVELETLSAEINRLRAANQEAMRDLAHRGASIDQGSFVALALQTMVEQLMPEGTIERARYDLAFEEAVSELFSQALTQAFAAKLGAPSVGGLVLPK